MARTVADAFNQYHQNYVKPQVESKLNVSTAAATYATQASLALKADLESPHFTGTPTAPTADNDTDSTQLATTEFCQNLIRRLVGAAPETLNTLVELATAINNDPTFAQTIVQALDGKLSKTDAATTYATKTELNNVSIDTTNLAKLNASNTFTADQTIERGELTVTSETNFGAEGADRSVATFSVRNGKAWILADSDFFGTCAGLKLDAREVTIFFAIGDQDYVYTFKTDGIYLNGTKITN